MKKLKIDELIPGMITAEDVYNYNDQLILPKGLVLNDKSISKLQFYAIYQIRIEDELADAENEMPEDLLFEDIPMPEEIPAEIVPEPLPAVEDIPLDIPPEPLPAVEDIPAEIIPEPLPVTDEFPVEEIPEPAAPAPEKKKSKPAPRFDPINVVPASSLPETSKGFSLPTASYKEKMKSSEDFQQFKHAFDEEVEDFKGKINEVVLKNAPLDVNILLDDALNLVSQGQHSAFSIFDMLHSMRENDDTTYTHCINVGLFCNVFAGWLKLSEEDTKLATLCGLLHDVGKLRVPEELLKKTEAYTEEEKIAIKAHTREGYLLVKNLDIDSHIKNAILTHHERCDGSGYPFGLSGFRIDPFAKMVAIADVYDSMTSSRAYRGAMSPIQAIEMMQEEGIQKYDVRFIMIFLENVMNTFIGNRVLLSSGEKGEIIFINKSNITRPTIKCQNHFVDLDEEKDIQIVSML